MFGKKNNFLTKFSSPKQYRLDRPSDYYKLLSSAISRSTEVCYNIVLCLY